MRIKIVFALMASFWLVLVFRIYFLSVDSNVYYENIAEQNAVKTQFLASSRGLIYDINNKPLAVNKLGFSVSFKPHLSDKDLDNELLNLMKFFPDQDFDKLKKEYKKENSPYNQDYISIIDFIDYDKFIANFANLSTRSNLKISSSSKRFYPYNDLASHIIGYVGRANVKDIEGDKVAKITNYSGRTGIEKYYNDILQGKEGYKKIKVNALNQELQELEYVAPSSKDIKLTIDLELQKFISEIFGKDAGSVIVMNVKDGAILAGGSFPEYNLNPFVSGISQNEWEELLKNLDHPFTNKLVNGLYPPGSVIKMAMSLAFLDSGKIKKNDTFNCTGSFELGGRKFRCWNPSGHGLVDMNSAIRESCDVYFYKASLKVGIDFIAPIMQRFGFGVKTDVDLPNEFVGTVPSREWKFKKQGLTWFNGETLITSIGQGNFLVTPMQIARYTAMLATGRNILPHFLHSIGDQKTDFIVKDEIFTPFEKTQLPSIRKAMQEVANHPKGTASKYFKKSLVEIAAKTGTAQVVGISQSERERIKEEDMIYLQRSHAWLTTYAPYDNPQFVVSMIVEHGGHGGSAAGPKISQIYNKLVEMGYIKLKNHKG